jgi:glycosyltransferase involved in cell wall biosynthesis
MARFLLLTHIYPPAIDGGSKVIAKMGEYLEKQGHQVLVLTSNCLSSDDFVKIKHATVTHPSTIISLPVITIFHQPLKLISKIFPDLKVFSKGPIFELFSFFKFLVSCLQFHSDYILAGPLPTTIVLYANFLKKLTGAKLIINASFHPTDPDFFRKPLINTLKNADYLWTLTDFETNYFHHNFKIPFSKMINLGNGVDQSLLRTLPSQNNQTKNLLFIGSFAAHKGLNTLLDAFYQLPSNTTLTLAGQPTLYFPQIEKRLSSPRIKIVKNFPSSQLSSLIDSCTILISPSTQESFGLVLPEAWARKKPVIAANIPASLELITKSNGGLTFKTNDSFDLVKKIKILLKSPSLSQKYGLQGFDYVQSQATWDKISKKLWTKIS